MFEKYRKAQQEKQQAQQEIDNWLTNKKIQAKKDFLATLEKWRKGTNTAFGLSCLYEREKLDRKTMDKTCQDKDISVSLILGKGCYGGVDGVAVDGVDYEYPPNLR